QSVFTRTMAEAVAPRPAVMVYKKESIPSKPIEVGVYVIVDPSTVTVPNAPAEAGAIVSESPSGSLSFSKTQNGAAPGRIENLSSDARGAVLVRVITPVANPPAPSATV